jgi:hypothetical protein
VRKCWPSCSCVLALSAISCIAPSLDASHASQTHTFCPPSKIVMPSFRYTQEIVTLNSLNSCAVQAVSPVRKSCWEIKSLHPDAASGSYKIKGPDGQPLSVQCDMTSQGGGWTLAGVAIFGQHGKSGYSALSSSVAFLFTLLLFCDIDIGSNPAQVGTAKVS